MKKQGTGSIPIKVKCVRNDGCEASLKIGKIYNAIKGQFGVIGVIDEEGECYIYSDEYVKEVND